MEGNVNLRCAPNQRRCSFSWQWLLDWRQPENVGLSLDCDVLTANFTNGQRGRKQALRIIHTFCVRIAIEQKNVTSWGASRHLMIALQGLPKLSTGHSDQGLTKESRDKRKGWCHATSTCTPENRYNMLAIEQVRNDLKITRTVPVAVSDYPIIPCPAKRWKRGM